MPSSLTQHTVFNMALDMIAEPPATSVLEGRPEVRWLNRNFAPYVERELRANIWDFSVELHELTQYPTAPAYRWLYSYNLPNGWLRVLPLTYEGTRTGTTIPSQVLSGRLHTDLASGCRAEIIMNRQVPGEWDPLFGGLIAARLAHGMAHTFTRKTTFVSLVKEMVDAAYDAAITAEAFEGTPTPIEQHDVVRVRSLWS